jgi:site-specific recombinase XerD
MSRSLIRRPAAAIAPLHDIAEDAQRYLAVAKSANTKRAYSSDWLQFTRWCSQHDQSALPAAVETIVLYVTDLAKQGRKASTLERRLAAISQAHQSQGYTSPTQQLAVRAVMAGIRRTHGSYQTSKAALITDDIKLLVNHLPTDLIGLRDRALLLVGFAGAFRRSELVALNVDDIDISRHGARITIRHSKTDQYAEGQVIGIPRGQQLATCPVTALRTWLDVATITAGPIFRSVNRHGQIQAAHLTPQSVALVVKRAALAAGLDPRQFSGHSLRSGLATSAGAAGVSERKIMAQTRHRSTKQVRKYIQDGERFVGNAAGLVGL